MDELIEKVYVEQCKGKKGRYKAHTAIADHLPFLRHLVEETDAKCVIELGVFTGQSASAFLSGLLSTDGELWSCDIQKLHHPATKLADCPLWTFWQMTAQEALDYAPDSASILLYDAGADEERLIWALDNYGKRVIEGGYILVHDMDAKENQVAIARWLADHPEYVYELRDGLHPMAVIRK